MATAKILGQDHKVLNNTDEQFEEGSSIVYPFAEDRDIFIEDTIDSSLLEFDKDDVATNLFAVLKSIFKKAKEVVITTKSHEDDDGTPLVDPSLSKILFNSNGTFTLYNPDFEKLAEGETAEVTFTYILNTGGAKNGNGNGKVVVREVTVEITGTNEAPIIVDELDIDVTEDTVFEGQLVATDIDSDDDSSSLTYQLVSTDIPSGFVLNTDGSYTLDASMDEYQYLGVGDTATYTFSWQAMDSHDAVSGVDNVTITMTGTNDIPVIVATSDLIGEVTELVVPEGSIGDGGTIEFSDVDVSDIHGIASIAAASGVLGSFTASVTSDTTGSGTGGVISWNYTLLASDIEYLKEGETKVESFTIVLDDGNGGTVERTIDVTITGTNDAPVIVAHENLEVDEGDSISGQVVATDIDSDDNSSSLTYILVEGDSIPGFTFNSNGTYSLDANADAYLTLTRGEIVEYTFKWQAIDIHDSLSGIDTVLVTITGTNDLPVVEYTDLMGAVTELVVPEGSLSDSGTINFTDDNIDDTHTVSSIIAPVGALGSLTAYIANDTTGSGLGGVISWEYTVVASDVEYLAQNQTKTESFVLTLDDGNGGTVERTIDVTITGTNDAPEIVTHSDIAITEDSTLRGQVVATDIDSDDNSISLTYMLVAGADIPGFTFNADGSYTLDATVEEYQNLAKDETVEYTFRYKAEDSRNEQSAIDDVKIIITGTNDTPTVASALTTYTFNLLEGASDVDHGAQLHIDNLVEADAKDGWSINGNTMSIDSDLYRALLDSGETETFNFTYNIVDEHGASVPQSLNFEVEGKDIPDLTISTSAGSSANVIMLTVTANPFDDETLTLSFNNLPDGAVILDGSTPNILEPPVAPVAPVQPIAPSMDDYNIFTYPAALIIYNIAMSQYHAAMVPYNQLLNEYTNDYMLYLENSSIASNDVRDGVSNFSGTETFKIVLAEDQDVDNVEFLVTLTDDNGAQNIQPVELSYDVASSSELLSFSSIDQNMWGNFNGIIGWHEYIPFVGEVSQEWNDETKVWDELDVEPWSSGWFNVLDLNINSTNIYDILLALPKAALDGAKWLADEARDLLQIAQDWLIDATAQFNQISAVSLAWIDYGLKNAAYVVTKIAYDGAKWLADEAKDNMNADAQNLINQENWLSTLYTQRANLVEDAKVYVSTWVSTATWNPSTWLDGYWTTSWFYDPIKYALVGLKNLEILAQKAYILLVEGDAWLTELAYDGLKAIQDGLYDPMVSAENSKNEAYTDADNLEDDMHDEGYYTDLSYDDGDGVLITGAAVLATGEVVTAEASVLGAEGAVLLADGVVVAAQETYDFAYDALELAIDVSALDFSTELKVDTNVYAEIGLQIDFQLDLGSVDTNIDYTLTSYTQYNKTTDMLSILPTMTNMTTGDTVAYSTVSPNITFFVAILYDIWADFTMYMDGYLSAWHLELNDDNELVPVNGMIFDMSPDSDEGITINTTVSTNSWGDLLATIPEGYLPDLPTDLETGELVLVDFDSTELEPFEVPFIDTLTDGMLNIEVAFPTVQTEGVESEYTESFFEEGGLVSVDFSEISSAVFNLVNAKLEYSEEFLEMYPSVSALGDSQTIDDLVNSLVDAFLAILWDNLDAQSTAAPIFVLDATDESSTSLLHVNIYPDEVMTDTLSDDTANFGFYTSYGESDPVIKVTLDIDAIVAVIVDKVITAIAGAVSAGSLAAVLEAIPAINPLDVEFGIAEILEMVEVPEDVAEEITNFVDLSIGIEAADIDAYAQVDFSQEFSLSIDDMSYKVTFENDAVEYFAANTEGELLINNASSYDENSDGVVEYSLEVVPTAMFSNDTEVGLSMGYSIELLQASLAAGVTLPLEEILGEGFPNIPISLVDIAIGPVLTIEGDLDILDVDIFESRFEFDVGSDETELLTVGVTDETMFVA